MSKYRFPCGCEFDIIGPPPGKSKLPLLDIDADFFRSRINYDCPLTWKLLCDGLTKGVFQLESKLGKHWSKEIQPQSIEHLSAIIATMRPGVLQATDENGKSMTQVYADRKRGTEEITYAHKVIEECLRDTYGVIIYQEQSMLLASKIAGFDLKEADALRKAIGKKLTEEMAKVKKLFLEKAESAKVVDISLAENVFEQIEKSQRYAFNRAHSNSYAYNGYWSAYCKAHFPLNFFTSYLYHAIEKQDPLKEMRALVEDAKTFGIKVNPPDFRLLETHFSNDGEEIYFGMVDVKDIGEKRIVKVIESAKELPKPLDEYSWLEFLIFFLTNQPKTIVENLISVGAFPWFGMPRQQMLFEFRQVNEELKGSKKELPWLRDNFDPEWKTLVDALKALAPTRKEGGGTSNINRKKKILDVISLLENPPHILEDTPNWIAAVEKKLLGISISCHITDSCSQNKADAFCSEIVAGRKGIMTVAVEINEVKNIKTKKGDPMGFLVVSDDSGQAENIIVFPDPWKEFGSLFTEGNTCLIQGELQLNKKDGKQAFIVGNAWQI